MGIYGLDKLEDFLKNCEKIIVIGVGNPLSRVDSIGITVCSFISEHSPNLHIELAFNAPENILSKFLSSDHTHVLVVDAVDAHLPVGSLIFLSPSDVASETATTHTVPMSLMLKVFESEGKQTLILGIQIPKDRDFSKEELQRIYASVGNVFKIILKRCG